MIMIKSNRLLATALFLGTLAIGILAGIHIDRAWLQPPRPAGIFSRPGDPPGPGGHFMGVFAKQLDLTPAQQDELDRLLKSYRQRFGELRRSMHPRYSAMRDSLEMEIRVLLTPEQLAKFEKMTFQVHQRRPGMHGRRRE